MDYTSRGNVKLYGNVNSSEDDVVIEELITGYSQQVDIHCRQSFGLLSETIRLKGVIDGDGVLMCYPPFPTIGTPTAVAWRYGNLATWTGLGVSGVEVDHYDSGCVVRFLSMNFKEYRGQRVQVQMTCTGGYANLDELPAGFEMAVRRLVWWGYKLREAPIHQTALAGYGGVVLPPSGWPLDIQRSFAPYVNYFPR